MEWFFICPKLRVQGTKKIRIFIGTQTNFLRFKTGMFFVAGVTMVFATRARKHKICGCLCAMLACHRGSTIGNTLEKAGLYGIL